MRVPKKPSGRRALPFYWWRRFRTHKNLPYKARLLDKIENGDFEYSEFFQQADWELHWMEDEKKEFIANYKGNDDPRSDSQYRDIEIISISNISPPSFLWFNTCSYVISFNFTI